MNNNMFNSLFNENEKKKIMNCCLKDSENSKDDIFLLSVEEAKKFVTQEELKSSDNWYWYWLRTAGPYSNNAVAYIWSDGIINDNYVKGCHATSGCNGACGVRPAIYIKK